jgi:hypothetical protein
MEDVKNVDMLVRELSRLIIEFGNEVVLGGPLKVDLIEFSRKTSLYQMLESNVNLRLLIMHKLYKMFNEDYIQTLFIELWGG